MQRNTSATGGRTARVTYRADSSEVNVEEPSWVEKSMDTAGDALAVAARKTKAGVNEIGDKAEDVGDAVKKGAKKTGKAVKDAATPGKKNH